MVIFEAMDENEAIWISGFETFSAHEGYGKTLKFVGDFRDKTPVSMLQFYKRKFCITKFLSAIM